MKELGRVSFKGDLIFVNIETSKGILQFTAYSNNHF